MTRPSEWTTTEEKVTQIVTGWRMLVHEQNNPGKPPAPMHYIKALESLPKEERSEILTWFNSSNKSLSELTEDNTRLTKLTKVLASDIDALNAEVARCKDIIRANSTPAAMTEKELDELRMKAGDTGMIAALPDHTEVSVYTPGGSFVRRTFTCGVPYKVANGTWVVEIMNPDGIGYASYSCCYLAKVIR